MRRGIQLSLLTVLVTGLVTGSAQAQEAAAARSVSGAGRTGRILGPPGDGSGGICNSFYLEILGSAAFYSVNYDRMLLRLPGTSIILVGRVGLMYWPGTFTPTYGVPVTLGMLVGRDRHRFELGGGRVFGEAYDLNYPPGWTAILGYRYQRREGGLIFRFSFTPYVSDPDQFGYRDTMAWGGVSLGVGF